MFYLVCFHCVFRFNFCLWCQIIVFQFGLGANAHYVILELYAQGNIILTDSEYMIMTLLRSHRFVFDFTFLRSFFFFFAMCELLKVTVLTCCFEILLLPLIGVAFYTE